MRGLQGRRMLYPPVAGMAAGLVSGIMGIGGGVLLVPLLSRYFENEQHKVYGTSLTAVFFISLSSAAFYAAQGSVNWILAAEIAVGSVCGAIIGATMMMRVSQQKLKRAFGVCAIALAVWSFATPFL